MLTVGLTGGIAAGKSTITKRLRELGALTADADQLSREAVEPGTPALARIRERFGDGVIGEDGHLDRAALGAIVFADDAARADLNAIVHPAVGALTAQRRAEAAATGPDAVFVYDVPLLVETGGRRDFDVVIVAEAPEEVRIDRLMQLRGLSREEAERRIASQASDEERRAIADIVIDTGGTLEETLSQTDAAWQRIRGSA
ncbi:dephospho-CoA kinase [Cnuibacter physcomitrellae]|uniref:dephospho-CoA kinase n=1 Tax=Cnuibacter physcomitrellae TaxID=1619308 RepID=UPI002175A350|nr:dephospho-CoA kinase [Cnuibacter physcomitrellae]MCS5496940.1 dephospho-CoA kinase [Cnuibacter physcomitrellae]